MMKTWGVDGAFFFAVSVFRRGVGGQRFLLSQIFWWEAELSGRGDCHTSWGVAGGEGESLLWWSSRLFYTGFFFSGEGQDAGGSRWEESPSWEAVVAAPPFAVGVFVELRSCRSSV